MSPAAQKHIADAIAAWQKREQLTDTQAAKRLGLSTTKLWQVYNMTIKLTPSELVRILDLV